MGLSPSETSQRNDSLRNDGRWELGAESLRKLTATREICQKLPPPEKVDFTSWMAWLQSFKEWLESTGIDPDFIGPRTLRVLLSMTIDRKTLDMSQLRAETRWKADAFNWGVAKALLRECCGMTRTHLRNALEGYKQGELPATLYAAYFSRISSEAGMNGDTAKLYLINGLNRHTRAALDARVASVICTRTDLATLSSLGLDERLEYFTYEEVQ